VCVCWFDFLGVINYKQAFLIALHWRRGGRLEYDADSQWGGRVIWSWRWGGMGGRLVLRCWRWGGMGGRLVLRCWRWGGMGGRLVVSDGEEGRSGSHCWFSWKVVKMTTVCLRVTIIF
jgi:hypothetical protein